MTDPLDDPVRSALTGPHAHLAQRRGRVLRYPPDLLKFITIPHPATGADWADAAALVGPERFPLAGTVVAPPEEWRLSGLGAGFQMVEDRVEPRVDGEAVRLGPDDLPEIVEFVARNRNGRPFAARTLELGMYLGLRHEGALVAMAGERLHPAGATELSAVCTEAGFRRRGLAARLVRTLVAGVRERGETAFLHVNDYNTGAIAFYERLGFRIRRPITMAVVHLPDDLCGKMRRA